MKTYYFSEESPADAAGDAILLPSTTFLGMDVVDSKNVDLLFKKIDGTHDNTHVKLTHAAGRGLDVMRVVAAAMAGNTRSNVIDIVEVANRRPLGGVLAETSSLITAITIAE